MIIGPGVGQHQARQRHFSNHPTLEDNINAYWKFEETATNPHTYTDSVKSLTLIPPFDDTWYATTASGQIGRGLINVVGGGLYVGGVYTNPANSALFGHSTDQTITFWAKPHSGDSGYYLFTLGSLGSAGGWNIGYVGGEFRVVIHGLALNTVGDYESSQVTTTESSVGLWQFVAVQFLLAEKQMRISINNGNWGTTTALVSDPDPEVVSAKVMQVNAASSFDEFGVWSRRLSSGELTDLYNNGVGLTY